MRNLLSALLLSAAALVALPVGSSFADGISFEDCGSDNVRQRGHHNSADVDVGCGYSSLDQNGDWNDGTVRSDGEGNTQVVGQYADGTTVVTEIDGDYSATGTVLTGDGSSAETRIHGDGNVAGVYSSQEGSHADVRIDGHGNRVMVRQN